jgi:hypothetical protein
MTAKCKSRLVLTLLIIAWLAVAFVIAAVIYDILFMPMRDSL